MPQDAPEKKGLHLNIQAYLLAGLLAITPLVVVWLVFSFFLGVLSDWGHPLAVELADFIEDRAPGVTPILSDPAVQFLIAIAVALLMLYLIGAIASRVLGAQIILLFERVVARIPLVDTIYAAAKKLIDVLRTKPGGAQRVVLIDFPHHGQKALGFVMRTFPDSQTGEELATVYVPTAINPTAGFLQIVPVSRLISTDIPADQAMTMIISGGAVAPDHISIAPPGTKMPAD
ncbi:MAG TPA: DUF502 domain-containing protein [Rhizomicrobium sp.]|jgi:uncharacterized membrane protein|nr:DUF502 domain-containing protein [Rhizomicrobium sp.]